MLAQLTVLDSLPVPKDLVPEPVPVKQKQKQNVAQVAQVAQLTHGQNALHKKKPVPEPVPIKKGGILWSCFFSFSTCATCATLFIAMKKQVVIAGTRSGTRCLWHRVQVVPATKPEHRR